MSIQNNFINTSFYPMIELPEDLWLTHLIENQNEKTILNFLKSCRTDLQKWKWISAIDSEKTLIQICLENTWDEILNWLSEGKVNFMPELKHAISAHDEFKLEKLLSFFKGNLNKWISEVENETLLFHALNEKNYTAAILLIDKGASLEQKLPKALDAEIQTKFKTDFFKNKYFYGDNGNKLFENALLATYNNSLDFALAFHYYPHDPAVLDILIKHPHFITPCVMKLFVRLADAVAFNKLIKLFLNCSDKTFINRYLTVDDKKDFLLNYCLRDIHNFTLMGFDFEYVVKRFDIIQSIIALSPNNRTLDKNVMSSYEIAQYIQFCLPDSALSKFEPIFKNLLADPTGFHEIWAIQRLLVLNLGTLLPFPKDSRGIEVAAYPTVANHIKASVSTFLKQKNLPDDWIYVMPNNRYTTDDCLNLIDLKKILKIFTGWTGGDDVGHGINVVIYDSYLFICNRGGGSTRQTSGICIYQMQNLNILKEIVPLFIERSKKTEEFVTEEILNHSSIKLLASVLCSQQKVGNCVWLSDKMGVYACFIASFLKKNIPVEKALEPAKNLFKEWSETDRLYLLNTYLDHPYHLKGINKNVKEGILFKQIIEKVIERSPKRLKSTYLDIILKKLGEDDIKKNFDSISYEDLLQDVQFAQFQTAVENGNTANALSFLDYFTNVNKKNISEDALLLYNFPDVNCCNKVRETLLHLACRHQNLDVIQELLKRGAKINLISKEKRLPLDEWLLSKTSINETPEFIEKKEKLIKFMIDGLDFNDLAKNDLFPIFEFIVLGYEFAIREILKKGFDLSLSSSQGGGRTAYHFAAYSKNEKIIQLIFDHCPDIEIKTTMGETPLFFAATSNNLCAANILLKKGANPNVKTSYGSTPLGCVRFENYSELIILLIAHGAKENNNI